MAEEERADSVGVENKVSSLETSVASHAESISTLFRATDSLSKPKHMLVIGIVSTLLIIVGGAAALVDKGFGQVEHSMDLRLRHVYTVHELSVVHLRELIDIKDQIGDERTIGVEESLDDLIDRVIELEREQ